MFSKVLIANRGEIACRIIRTLRHLQISSVAIYSEADGDSLHVSEADDAHCIGKATVSESYLQQETIIEVAKATGAEAIHPGYGLLSESPDFAQACEAAGLAFIGPAPEHMRAFALKHEARQLAERANVPLLPGSGVLQSLTESLEISASIGYPVMLKSSGGGGGIGMAICEDAEAVTEQYERVRRLAGANFGNQDIFIEKYVTDARHVEVQALGDGQGHIWTLGERDCSLQRRHQKVVEETPAPGLSSTTRNALFEAATRLLQEVHYRSAGTVEFLYDASSEAFYFLEVNTRLQVEHGITEAVTGIDLVEMMLRIAADELIQVSPTPQGHAIETRVYAENPHKDFQPSTGLLTNVDFPDHVRVDTWISNGLEVTPHYDPLLAKIVVHAPTRAEAVSAMATALSETRIDGITTNRAYLQAIMESEVFTSGKVATHVLDHFSPASPTFEVLSSGTLTTIHDDPGRIGYWEVGVPPSGPMDSVAFRLANELVGNPKDAAALEITLSGPSLQFHHETVIALTGADMGATLDETPLEPWKAYPVRSRQVLRLGNVIGPGARAYLAIRGGIDVPPYLGSRSTFALGAFGGHAGRPLRMGDILSFDQVTPACDPIWSLDPSRVPHYESTWEIEVLYGPHGAPEFFEESYIETFLATAWEVHFNSARTGIRLIGPKPGWAREDGGEAGLHPSNIHDNPYAIGAIDFTGDMPVILGPDGPSLGGFVCPFTIVEDQLWKMGQLSAGDRVRFRLATATLENPIMATEGDMVFRRSGDRNVLIEIGPPTLDIGLRLRVHQLYECLQAAKIPGVLDLTPGVRSLQVHFDETEQSNSIVKKVCQLARALPPVEDYEVQSRIVHLPLSWDDPSTQEAIKKYHATVRPNAPWYPSNIEFIRRINGLYCVEDVYQAVFDASYVVLGLGDVYLGAPVATPLDPRHRLVTTKYNPARTWTPENAVGIGGAYLCIYGMEGPGGYQFVGRTLQMWNRFRTTEHFTPGKPWLLRFFDQIRFFPVTTKELATIRSDFLRGRYAIRVEESHFRLTEYQQFLETHAQAIAAFRHRQQKAFHAERQRWEDAEEVVEDFQPPEDSESIPPGTLPLESPIAGNLWKLCVTEGDAIEEGQAIAILESMKMEMTIQSPYQGTISRILVLPGATISPGQTVAHVKT